MNSWFLWRFDEKTKNKQFKISDKKMKSSCAICIDEFNSQSLISVCKIGHMFHAECLQTWFQTHHPEAIEGEPNCKVKCPTCRARFKFKYLIKRLFLTERDAYNASSGDDATDHLSKIAQLETMLATKLVIIDEVCSLFFLCDLKFKIDFNCMFDF